MTQYRALGYVERDALRDDGPLPVIMCSEGRKGDGIDLRMSGAKLDRYRANPVLGYGHSYYGRDNLPIGGVIEGSIKVDGKLLRGELEYDQADDFAKLVERKMRDGYLRAVSIGFNVLRWEDPKSNYWTGGVAEEWELTELSVVPIGMDAQALVGGRGLPGPEGRLLRALAEEFGLDAIVAACQRLDGVPTPPAPPAPNDSVPAVSGIDQSAARNFLAALTTKGAV